MTPAYRSAHLRVRDRARTSKVLFITISHSFFSFCFAPWPIPTRYCFKQKRMDPCECTCHGIPHGFRAQDTTTTCDVNRYSRVKSSKRLLDHFYVSYHHFGEPFPLITESRYRVTTHRWTIYLDSRILFCIHI